MRPDPNDRLRSRCDWRADRPEPAQGHAGGLEIIEDHIARDMVERMASRLGHGIGGRKGWVRMVWVAHHEQAWSARAGSDA